MPLSFTTLDPIDDTSRAGVLVAYMEPTNVAFQPPTCADCILRAAASVRYVDPNLHAGGYVQLAYAYSDEPTGATALGDLELGALYALPCLGLVVHAGLTAPTGEDGYPERTVAFTESVPMLHDYVQAIPDGTSLRFGVVGRWQYRYVIFQADAGFDSNISSLDGTGYGTMFHFDAGIGITDGTSAVTLELANLSYLDGFDSGANILATTLDTLALSARLDWRNLEPFFAVVAPLDEDASAAFKLAVIAGIDIMLR